jgi:D-serine dehydratase
MNHTKDSARFPSGSGLADSISPLNKGLGAMDGALKPAQIPGLGWNLLREDLSLPAAVLYEEKIAHNLRWMQKFIDSYGVQLAPHGKTTMAPKLFLRQIEGGAWGITMATAHQARVAHAHGVRRVIMANQLVGRQNLAIISRLLEDAEFEFFCLVDSAEGIDLLAKFFGARGQKLNVLLEVGPEGGRTGVRNPEQLRAVTAALDRWREQIVLCGVEVFEGVLKEEAAIRALLERTVQVAKELAQEKRFGRSPVILTGAGSAWYDVVAEIFSKADVGEAMEIILRPGCYLTHDSGIYRSAQAEILKRSSMAHGMKPALQPALQLWAYVHSVLEKQKAIIGLGKRDAAFDAGLPTPVLHFRPGTQAPVAAPSGWTVTSMMDQHAFMQIGEGDDIRVGDMVGFDISHPCLTFDKWRYLAVVDRDYRVVDVVETYF